MADRQDGRRPLTERERSGLYELLDAIRWVREATVALKTVGCEPPFDLALFDDGAEVIRALATDTHSLVRRSDAGGRSDG